MFMMNCGIGQGDYTIVLMVKTPSVVCRIMEGIYGIYQVKFLSCVLR